MIEIVYYLLRFLICYQYEWKNTYDHLFLMSFKNTWMKSQYLVHTYLFPSFKLLCYMSFDINVSLDRSHSSICKVSTLLNLDKHFVFACDLKGDFFSMTCLLVFLKKDERGILHHLSHSIVFRQPRCRQTQRLQMTTLDDSHKMKDLYTLYSISWITFMLSIWTFQGRHIL